MKYSLKAAGIIEAMVVLLLLTVGVTGVYNILVSSQRLSVSTSYRIEAIQIARDGLEAMTNIRDTNWIEFGGDVRNCWISENYNQNCIGSTSAGNKIRHNDTQSLRVYRDESNGKFLLQRQNRTGSNFTDTAYRNRFRVYYDSNGFYTQSGSLAGPSDRLLTREYTREIQINYFDNNGNPSVSNSPISTSPNRTNPIMDVTVIVQWADPATSSPRRLEMTTRLTNWKDRN